MRVVKGNSPFPALVPTELAVGLALAHYDRITGRFAPGAARAPMVPPPAGY